MPSNKVYPTAGPEGPTLQDVAHLIKDNKARNIIVLVGAGISTSAGIPDFRSPETGLYSNLAQYNLPYAEAIFDITYFLQRPEAFFTLAKEIYPGNYLPTLTHYFFVLMHKKGVLKRLFTQNVDTLERQAGLPAEAIVEAHGSFATAHCLNCRQEYQAEELRPRIAKGEVIRCDKPACKKTMRGLIKSDIVFFGESLPPLFFQRLSDFRSCDLLITIGTSLKVQPFASLIDRVGDDVPRLLINLESVGEMDEYESSSSSLFGQYREDGFDFNGASRGGKEFSRDAKWIGEADKGIRELARALGWEEELEELWEKGRKDHEAKEHLRTASSLPPTPAKKSKPAKEENKEEEVSAPPAATTAKATQKPEAEASTTEEVASNSTEKESLEERIKKEEEEERKGREHAKQEAMKIAQDIGQITETVSPDESEQRKEQVKKEEEKEFAQLADDIEKLNVQGDKD